LLLDNTVIGCRLVHWELERERHGYAPPVKNSWVRHWNEAYRGTDCNSHYRFYF